MGLTDLERDCPSLGQQCLEIAKGAYWPYGNKPISPPPSHSTPTHLSSNSHTLPPSPRPGHRSSRTPHMPADSSQHPFPQNVPDLAYLGQASLVCVLSGSDISPGKHPTIKLQLSSRFCKHLPDVCPESRSAMRAGRWLACSADPLCHGQ